MPISAASDGPLLAAEGLTAGYFPRADVLHGCDLELRAGELVGIVGPNGAGKSTLLKTLFGLVPVRRGTLRLRGDDIAAMSRTTGWPPAWATCRSCRTSSPT